MPTEPDFSEFVEVSLFYPRLNYFALEVRRDTRKGRRSEYPNRNPLREKAVSARGNRCDRSPGKIFPKEG